MLLVSATVTCFDNALLHAWMRMEQASHMHETHWAHDTVADPAHSPQVAVAPERSVVVAISASDGNLDKNKAACVDGDSNSCTSLTARATATGGPLVVVFIGRYFPGAQMKSRFHGITVGSDSPSKTTAESLFTPTFVTFADRHILRFSS
jgi:hypothetical protein